jgi:type VI protein secretion system component VasK
MGLPVWVKLWLTLLNLVFLAAPACLPWPQAGIVLLAYAATGPLLLAFAVWSGGLTRVMGLAHLIAWVPLLVWLMLRWPSMAGPGATPYLVVLTVVVLVCLVLDLWDLWRWARGDRAVIGLSYPQGRRGAAARRTDGTDDCDRRP